MSKVKTWILVAGVFLNGAMVSAAQTAASQRFREAYIAETTERDIERAVSIYNELVSDSRIESSVRSESSYRLGVCLERLGQNESALSAYREAITLGEAQSRPYVESAKSNAERLEIQLRPMTSVQSPPILKPGQKFFTPIHQLMIAGASVAFGTEGATGLGLELIGYEYIHPIGLAFKISPLNAAFIDKKDHYNATTWTPLWLRYYLAPETNKSIAYVGVGYARTFREDIREVVVRHSDELYSSESSYHEYTDSERTGVALEAGITIGDLGKRSSRFSVKLIPFGSDWEKLTVVAGYDFSIGVRSGSK
jgi:hypothetical protein